MRGAFVRQVSSGGDMTAKNTEDTIEFFIPESGLELEPYLQHDLPENATGKQIRLRKQAIHHLARYYWAAMTLKDMAPGTVLDVACGSGYGSQILAKALPDHTIIGGDYDPRAVEHATRTYGNLPNLSYHQVDIVTWVDLKRDKMLGRFDYVVSFDTIEHLLYREISFVNFAEFIRPAGALLFSTPCGSKQNKLNPGWEHHKIEYSYRYLYNLMRRFFNDVRIPDDGSLPHLDFWHDVVNKDKQRYTLRANPMICQKPRRLTMNGVWEE